MKITTIGIDLANTVFQVHGVNTHGRTELKKQIKREQLAVFFAKLEPSLIGIEAAAVRTTGRASSRNSATRSG